MEVNADMNSSSTELAASSSQNSLPGAIYGGKC